MAFFCSKNEHQCVKWLQGYLKEKEMVLKKKKKLQYLSSERVLSPQNQNEIKAAYCGPLVQGSKHSPQVTIPLFCETKQKAPVPEGVGGSSFKHLEASWGSARAFSGQGLEKSYGSTPGSPSAAYIPQKCT